MASLQETGYDWILVDLIDERFDLVRDASGAVATRSNEFQKAGLDPTLLVAANTSGGVVGKMISPQNLTIAATAVGIVGREADLFRKTIFWSIGLLFVLCVLIYLQSNVLAWMLP